ncbi:MAG: GDSL-type esterase/lipase family protein [bacterium]
MRGITTLIRGMLVAAVLVLGSRAAHGQADYPFRDNDVVVFLGDSNTAGAGFAKTLELYTLLRYPARDVKFYNAGIGGDTATGGAARMQRDVFDHDATVVVVTFGINDILWGAYADAAHRQAFLDGIRDIVIACRDRAHLVRVILNSYPLTNGSVGQTEPNPTQQYLQAMSLDAFALATSLAPTLVQTNDVFSVMWDVFLNGRKTNPIWGDRPAIGGADGVHLSDFGHKLWAYAMLKNFGLSPIVSSITLGAAPPRSLATTNATVASLSGNATNFSFTRKDTALPINFGGFQAGTLLLWINFSSDLNQYVLKVTELATGNYAVDVEGRTLGTWSSTQLAAGLNLGPDVFDPWWPSTPWGGKSLALTGMTEARHELQVDGGLAQSFLGADPNANTIASQLNTINQRMIAVQRDVAQPYAMHFTVRKVP